MWAQLYPTTLAEVTSGTVFRRSAPVHVRASQSDLSSIHPQWAHAGAGPP